MSNSEYEITLKVYRDCFNGLAPFDNPAFISIFKGANNYLETIELFNPSVSTLPLNQPDPCVGLPSGICVQEAIYKQIVKLPPNGEGYTLLYQRCCRNHTIKNIESPLSVGATYSAFIPDTSVILSNGNPEFVSLPPVFLCNNIPFTYDHSAKDPDGDSIVYQFCSPFLGGDSTDQGAQPDIANPLLTDVPWSGGFSGSYPLSSDPAMFIDPKTGKLTGTPNAIGQYVVGICAIEYRKGKLIGYTKRDFQFNVVKCPPKPTAVLPERIRSCGFDVSFINKSINASFYDWDFGTADDNTDKSKLFEPSFTYPNIGKYKVTLIINNETICADTAETIIDIYNVITGADFEKTNVCNKENIVANDISKITEGTIQKRIWTLQPNNETKFNDPKIEFITTEPGTKTLKLTVENENGCRDSIVKEIKVFPIPKLKIQGPPLICKNEVGKYEVTGNFTKIKWSSNPALACVGCVNQTIKGINTQMFYVNVSDENNCKNTDSIKITVPEIEAKILSDTSICFNNDHKLIASGGKTYIWYPSNNIDCFNCLETNIKLLKNTQINLVAYDENGCKDTTNMNFTVKAPINSNIAPTNPICYGKTSNILLTAPTATSINWQPTQLLDCNGCKNPKTFPLYKSQKLNVKITDKDGCIKLDTTEVIVYDRQIDLGKDREICFGDSVVADLKNVNVISWIPTSICQTCTRQVFYPKETITYKATVLDQHNCTYADTLNISVRKNFPIFDFEVEQGRCIDLPVKFYSRVKNIDTVCFSKLQYLWKLGDGITDTVSNPIVSYTIEGEKEISLQVKNVPDTVFKNIKLLHGDSCLKNIYIPNTFTPNGDGVNDILFVRGINIKTLKFYLYNNLGEHVFFTNNLHMGWDGIFKGQMQTNQVFVYYCEAIFWDGSKAIKEGNVTLLE